MAQGILTIDKLHTSLQPLVPRLMVLNMFSNFTCNEAIVVFQADGGRFNNEGFRDFASAVVWDGNHGAVGDCWMG